MQNPDFSVFRTFLQEGRLTYIHCWRTLTVPTGSQCQHTTPRAVAVPIMAKVFDLVDLS